MQRFCQPIAAAALAIAVACLWPTSAAGAEEPPSRSVFVMRVDGSDVRKVASVAGFEECAAPRFSHDGAQLAFHGRDPAADIYRLFTVHLDGSRLAVIGPGAHPDWSPDDKQIAFSTAGKTSLKGGVWVQNLDGRGREYLAAAAAPRWSPDGSQMAMATGFVLDLIDSSQRTLFQPDDKILTIRPDVAWSPDGAQLAAAVERDGRWEVVIVSAAGSQAGLRRRLTAQADGVAWSPDGQTLAVALWNEKLHAYRLHLVSVEGDAPPREIAGQQGDNRQPAFSPDGKLLSFVSSRPAPLVKPTALAVEPVELKQVTAFDCGGTCYSLALAPDGRTALLGANMRSRGVQLWDIDGNQPTRKYPLLGIFVAVSPDGKHAACTERFKPAVTLFDLQDGTPIRELPAAAPIWFVEFSLDGTRLVCGSQNGDAAVFDVASGKRLLELHHQGGRVVNGALSPDGSIAAISASDHKVHLWSVPDGKLIRALDHPELVWGVAFSPDGRLLATGTGGTPIGPVANERFAVGDDNRVRLWDVASGEVTRALEGHTHAVIGIAFSPDSRRLVTGGFDGTLRLWDVERGSELSRVSGKSRIMNVAYAPNGKLVLAAGGNIRVQMTDRRLTDYPEERVRVFRIQPLEPAGED